MVVLMCQSCGCERGESDRCAVCGASADVSGDNMDNALVGQKDEIIRLINAAGDADELAAADRLLRFAAPVWDASDYGYKTRELRHRVRDRACDLIEGERQYLARSRRNDRTRRTTETNIARLELLRIN